MPFIVFFECKEWSDRQAVEACLESLPRPMDGIEIKVAKFHHKEELALKNGLYRVSDIVFVIEKARRDTLEPKSA